MSTASQSSKQSVAASGGALWPKTVDESRIKLGRPRGYFYKPESWTKDKTHKYFQGYMNKVVYPVSKGLFAILLAYALTHAVESKKKVFLIMMAGVAFY